MTADGSSAAQRFFFVHLMRTGGTTFEQQLRKSFPRDAVYPNPDCDFPDGDLLRHLDISYLLGLAAARQDALRFYYGHFPFFVTDLLGHEVTTFTVLRHPVARTISLLRVMGERRDSLRGLTMEQRYDDPDMFGNLIHNHQTKLLSMTADDRPKNYLDAIEIDGARLARAKQNLARVDVIGLTEHYGEFLEELRTRFGWRLSEEARLNAAERAHDEPAHLRDRIARDNAFDIELYDYARELVGARRRP